MTRQNVPTLEGTSAAGFAKGAYVLAGADEDADEAAGGGLPGWAQSGAVAMLPQPGSATRERPVCPSETPQSCGDG